MRTNGRARRGVTLIEVLIASIILALAGAAVFQVFSGANTAIRKTDERRELRYYLREIFSHLNRQPLHELWNHYGPEGLGPARPLAGAMALVDANGKMVDPEKPENNPLAFTQAFLDDMARDGLDARIGFDFFFRDSELRYESGKPSPTIGLLHMQAGAARVTIFDREDPVERPLLTFAMPIMCPTIVGRPGLQLASCPALQKSVECEYGPLLKTYENNSWDATEAECN